MRIEENDLVLIKGTNKTGKVKRLLYNPFFPKWICSPNYLVQVDGETSEGPSVFVKKQLKKL